LPVTSASAELEFRLIGAALLNSKTEARSGFSDTKKTKAW
jgi:hypothetical protein